MKSAKLAGGYGEIVFAELTRRAEVAPEVPPKSITPSNALKEAVKMLLAEATMVDVSGAVRVTFAVPVDVPVHPATSLFSILRIWVSETETDKETPVKIPNAGSNWVTVTIWFQSVFWLATESQNCWVTANVEMGAITSPRSNRTAKLSRRTLSNLDLRDAL